MPLAVCATPIGNLEDVTLRVLRELAEAELVLCEDTRRTRILLQRHAISARLVSYHEHNEAGRTAELVPQLVAGARIALVSDAGLPGVNDPGARLIAAALEAGVLVTVLPGASAVETALVASGFPAERYQFAGYLPRGAAALEAFWEEVRRWPWPLVALFLPRTPADLAPGWWLVILPRMAKALVAVDALDTVRSSASAGSTVRIGTMSMTVPMMIRGVFMRGVPSECVRCRRAD